MKLFLYLAVFVAAVSAYSRVQDDPKRNDCLWKSNGQGSYILSHVYYRNSSRGPVPRMAQMILRDWDVPGVDMYANIEWRNAPDDTKPPLGWDGTFASLSYRKPEEDSILYKWLLCYPMLMPEHMSSEPRILDDSNRMNCKWEQQRGMQMVNGKSAYVRDQVAEIPGGFLKPYRQIDDRKEIEVEVPAGFQKPPSAWDGRASTLGFPMPEEGTPEYNMLLCWPYDFKLTESAPQESN